MAAVAALFALSACTTEARLAEAPLSLPSGSVSVYVPPLPSPALAQQTFMWTTGRPPVTRFGPVDRPALRRVVSTDRSLGNGDLMFAPSLAATFGSPAAARDAAARTRGRLAPEASYYRDPARAVVVVGATVVVRSLRHRTDRQETRRLLRRDGGQVVAEHDAFGEGDIVADLSCRVTDRGAAREVARDLEDYSLVLSPFDARAPWVGPPLSADQRRARSTYRRLSLPAIRRMRHDRKVRALLRVHRRVSQLLGYRHARPVRDRLAQRVRTLADDAGLRVDPRVVAWSFLEPRGDTFLPEVRAARDRWYARGAPLMGARQGRSVADGSVGDVRLGRRLDLSFLFPDYTGPGLATLALYLDRAGCTDLRYRLTDWDDVRGD